MHCLKNFFLKIKWMLMLSRLSKGFDYGITSLLHGSIFHMTSDVDMYEID